MEIRRVLQQKFVETATAKEAVLFANTSSFLVHRLRKDASTSYVAHELPTADILDLLNEQCNKSFSGPLDVVRGYVLLVALSLKDDLKNFKNRLNAIDLAQLEWGGEIRRMILEERVPTTVSDVTYRELSLTHRTDVTSKVSSGTITITDKD